jgi:hypothetical protein
VGFKVSKLSHSKPYNAEEVFRAEGCESELNFDHRSSRSVKRYGGEDENDLDPGTLKEVTKRAPPPGFDFNTGVGKYRPPHMIQSKGVSVGFADRPRAGQQAYDCVPKEAYSASWRPGGYDGRLGVYDGKPGGGPCGRRMQATYARTDYSGEQGRFVARSDPGAQDYPVGRPPCPPRHDARSKGLWLVSLEVVIRSISSEIRSKLIRT